MTGPLWYLAGRSTRNRLLRQVRRLRTPRYALALVLGLAYLWAVTARQRPAAPRDVNPATVELLATIGVTAVLLYAWIFGADRRALAFSRAEVTWLFPAPVSRRQLIQYKLFRGQLVILFNAILWTFLLSGGWNEVAAWSRALSIWILLTTLTLHRIGVALFRSSLVEHGVAGVRSRAITIALVVAAAVVATLDASGAVSLLRAGWGQGPAEFMGAMREVAGRPVFHALLLPARLVVRPLIVDSASEWFRAILPAAAILVLNFVWVVRSDAAFEESAAAAALARSRAGRGASRGPTFTARRIPQLAPVGWPAAALLWKNLAAVMRTSRTRGTVLAYAVATVVVGGLGVAGAGASLLEIVGWMTAMWAGFLLVLGPQWVRNDLRSELARLAVLRSYPVRGRTVVGAETAGSTAVLTALELGLLGIAYLAFLGTTVDDPPPQLRSAVLVGAVVLLPAINFLAMLIQNGTALLLPGWVRIGPDRPLGVEALGHNMLMMSGFVVILAVLLLVPAAAAAGVFLELERIAEWWAVVPAAAAAVVIAAVEAHLLLGRLGRVFEMTDPSSVPRSES